jgi:hypothetical protein
MIEVLAGRMNRHVTGRCSVARRGPPEGPALGFVQWGGSLDQQGCSCALGYRFLERGRQPGVGGYVVVTGATDE